MINRAVCSALLLIAAVLVQSVALAQNKKPTLYMVCNAKKGSLPHQFFLELYREVEDYMGERRRVAFASTFDDFTPTTGDYAAQILITTDQLGGNTVLYTVAILITKSIPCTAAGRDNSWEYRELNLTNFTDNIFDSQIRSLRKFITDSLPR